MLNLANILEDSARTYPERVALVGAGRRLTYAEVDSAASRVAELLQRIGIRPGDHVALSCPNVPSFPVIYYGILKAGAVVVPLNVLFKRREIAYHLRDSDAKAYFCFEGGPELPMGEEGSAGFAEVDGCEHLFFITPGGVLRPADGSAEIAVEDMSQGPVHVTAAATEADDTAVILYTSGTTGQPKGAELSHANLVLNALTANRLFDASPYRPDTHLVTLPLFHSFGSTVQMNAGFSVASTLVLLPRFDAAAALELFRREEITFFAGVPTMYWALLSALTDDVDVAAIAARLRMAVSGGASLPVEIIKEFHDRFGVQIQEGYGLSETSPIATFNHPDRGVIPGSIGTPVWGVQCRLVDADWNDVAADAVGELAIRGHNIMKGYYKRPAETAEVLRDGWFRSGDLARRDADGNYYIVDRAKDMIIRGGYNVYPREIEELLLTHPEVSLAAVVGVPHESLGEEVKAFVIPKPRSAVTPDEIVAWCKERLASYKYPRTVELCESLPMTATGKILKRELKQRQA